ncbi:FAD-dependent oxidoreductase [Ornithinimicrobium sp. LYQ92]|uniref:FAD-dependent oxidoreductase n=1 Tax=Serinicoccus sp. LYQ92 TaxID=3378798 RepID=UPI003852FB0A
MSTPPLVVIGAGPIGLSAAAHAVSRGLDVVVLEAGPQAASSVLEWAHVRLFSPWSEVIDPVAATLLVGCGWEPPEPTAYPSGADWAARYLQPLADALDATDHAQVHYGARVTGVSRQGRDRLVDDGRLEAPFTVLVTTAGATERLTARAVIDAGGTWATPNPLGTDGLPALGEHEAARRISYRVPDLRDVATRNRYAGRHVALAGTGASAQTVLAELGALADSEPGTRVSWLVRRASASGSFGGGTDDQLVARGTLGDQARRVAGSGVVRTVTGFRTTGVGTAADGSLTLTSVDGQQVGGIDEIIAVTGFRPDHTVVGELRLGLDPVLQAPTALAPLIDPNLHSCGTVYPHGATELAHPEPGFFLAGMKSYGRAPSFLALTGFEQVRSIVAAVAGDREAAERVELVLPETGVCGGAGAFDAPEDSCCAAESDILPMPVHTS